MSERFKVVDSIVGEAIQFKDRDDPTKTVSLNKHTYALERDSGEVLTEVVHWLAPGKMPFAAGDAIEGEIVNQPRGGLKLSRARAVSDGGGHSGTPSPQSGPPPAPPPAAGPDSRPHPDRRSAAIQRQHSQEMALRFIAATGHAADMDLSDKNVVGAYLVEVVKPLTDWFDRDIPKGG